MDACWCSGDVPQPSTTQSHTQHGVVVDGRRKRPGKRNGRHNGGWEGLTRGDVDRLEWNDEAEMVADRTQLTS
eukprot:14557887-Alexandrium_andersonii.AAC.1